MCGIAGRYNFDGAPVAEELLRQMCASLRHRGPDDAGTLAEGPIGLAHVRLSIIDLSAAGHQPMDDPSGRYSIVFNGEIYNYLELRQELIAAGCVFRSHTDTEVILHAFDRFGPGCLKRLDGMFAFALWDRQARRLFLARDRVGKKPLYYYLDRNRIVFGSELKAILLDETIPRTVRDDALVDFMTYGFVPDPKTIFAGIYKLPPATWMMVDGPDAGPQGYWDLHFSPQQDRTLEDWSHEVESELARAVQCRMISDVPLGAFLSGGIDSGAVVAMMAQKSTDPVITTSIGFEEAAFDETKYARQVAERYRTEHHEDRVHYDSFETIVEILLEHFEEPFCDESAIATYYLSKLARRHVTVALSGDGGDEAFGGYTKYSRMLEENRLRRSIPGAHWSSVFLPLLRGRLAERASGSFARMANFIESLSAPDEQGIHLANAHLRDHQSKRLFNRGLQSRMADYRASERIENLYEESGTEDFLAATLYVDTRFLLPGDFLVKVDRMSMANSLEVRSPFLDHRLLELAARIPSSFKIHDGEKKFILKKALEPHLSEEILYRKKKGFDVPIGVWFADSLRPYVQRELIDDPGALADFFDMDFVRQIWSEFLGGRSGHKSLLWNLLMLKLWHRRWIG